MGNTSLKYTAPFAIDGDDSIGRVNTPTQRGIAFKTYEAALAALLPHVRGDPGSYGLLLNGYSVYRHSGDFILPDRISLEGAPPGGATITSALPAWLIVNGRFLTRGNSIILNSAIEARSYDLAFNVSLISSQITITDFEGAFNIGGGEFVINNSIVTTTFNRNPLLVINNSNGVIENSYLLVKKKLSNIGYQNVIINKRKKGSCKNHVIKSRNSCVTIRNSEIASEFNTKFYEEKRSTLEVIFSFLKGIEVDNKKDIKFKKCVIE